jgi:hypothetical protein
MRLRIEHIVIQANELRLGKDEIKYLSVSAIQKLYNITISAIKFPHPAQQVT